MKRGDLVVVSLKGDYGKPRPALIVQSDLFDQHPSVTLMPVTSELLRHALVPVSCRTPCIQWACETVAGHDRQDPDRGPRPPGKAYRSPRRFGDDGSQSPVGAFSGVGVMFFWRHSGSAARNQVTRNSASASRFSQERSLGPRLGPVADFRRRCNADLRRALAMPAVCVVGRCGIPDGVPGWLGLLDYASLIQPTR